jgi:hypothetical protein
MSIVKDVADLLKLLTDVVDNTRSIIKAINDGKEFLARKFPDARKDFAQLLIQMETTVGGLAKVTDVVQGFRFSVGSQSTQERDLTRFNKHVIKHNGKVRKLRTHIRKLKADCGKIRQIRDDLTSQKRGSSWSRMFALIGLQSGRKRDELAATMSEFYADDQRMIELIESTMNLAQAALKDVDKSLGPAGHAYAINVPVAAKMLGLYADMFTEPHQALQALADNLNETANALQ